MQTIPLEPGLPVRHLAAAFDNVTNSYKFLWFLAVLDEIEDGATSVIPLTRLLGRMVAAAWYPVNYFRISFGKQDVLARLVVQLLEKGELPLTARSREVTEMACREIAAGSKVGMELNRLSDYVPYRFIRPFFSSALQGIPDWRVNQTILDLSEREYFNRESPCLYRFLLNSFPAIEVHPSWASYLRHQIGILRGYGLWHLLVYLQRNNPTVPNLANKLFEPQIRNLAHARRFWNTAFERLHTIHCIYSGEPILAEEYSLDHFLPWRFVAHDNLWNIIPTSRRVNSAKGDRLPNFDVYFDRLAHTQFTALQVVIGTGKNNRLVEDYIFLLNSASLSAMRDITFEQFSRILHNAIAPQLQIAMTLGFQSDWTY
jgi:hypothetical protein